MSFEREGTKSVPRKNLMKAEELNDYICVSNSFCITLPGTLLTFAMRSLNENNYFVIHTVQMDLI